MEDGDGGGGDRGKEGKGRRAGRRGRDVALVSVTWPMPIKGSDKEYIDWLVDSKYFTTLHFCDREETTPATFSTPSCVNASGVDFLGEKELRFEALATEDGETKGWRCSYCIADRSASPANPSRTCPRRWNVEIGKRFLHFLLARGFGDFELRNRTCIVRITRGNVLGIKNTPPNKTSLRWAANEVSDC